MFPVTRSRSWKNAKQSTKTRLCCCNNCIQMNFAKCLTTRSSVGLQRRTTPLPNWAAFLSFSESATTTLVSKTSVANSIFQRVTDTMGQEFKVKQSARRISHWRPFSPFLRSQKPVFLWSCLWFLSYLRSVFCRVFLDKTSKYIQRRSWLANSFWTNCS